VNRPQRDGFSPCAPVILVPGVSQPLMKVQVRTGLHAGGNRIRTDGPSRAERRVLFDDHYSYPNVSPNPGAVCVDRSAGRHNQSLHSDKMKRSMVAAGITVGFSWQGTHYRSLSALARTITGTAWSGPLFFGLKPGRPAAPRASERSGLAVCNSNAAG
jgi:hypothetical protein